MDELLYEIPAGAPDEVFLAQPEWDANEMGNNFMAQMGMRGGQGRAQTGATMTGTAIKRT